MLQERLRFLDEKVKILISDDDIYEEYASQVDYRDKLVTLKSKIRFAIELRQNASSEDVTLLSNRYGQPIIFLL